MRRGGKCVCVSGFWLSGSRYCCGSPRLSQPMHFDIGSHLFFFETDGRSVLSSYACCFFSKGEGAGIDTPRAVQGRGEAAGEGCVCVWLDGVDIVLG